MPLPHLTASTRLRPWPLSGALMLLALLLLVALPPCRREAQELCGAPSQSRMPKQRDYEAVALAHPDDAGIWLGYAAFAQVAEAGRTFARGGPPGAQWKELLDFHGPPARTTAQAAYARAVALQPASPAARLGYAISLTAGELQCADRYGPEGRVPVRPRTAAETASLRSAETTLLQAGDLAPGNAAVDYLLAWVYVADRRDAGAVAAAQHGAEKLAWSLYRQDLARGQWRLVDELGPGLDGRLGTTVGASLGKATIHLREVAWMLATTALRERERGNDAAAIACLQCIVRQGYLMRLAACDSIEVMVAQAITEMAAPSGLVAPAQWAAAARIGDGEARVKRQKELRHAALGSYLRGHGRADLAAGYEQEVQQAELWRQKALAASREGLGHPFGGAVPLAIALGLPAVLVVVMGLLLGFAGLVCRCWRYRAAGGVPTLGRWLMLLGFLVVPVLPLAVALSFGRLPSNLRTNLGLPLLLGALLVGLIGWQVGLILIVARHRAALSAAARPRRGRCYLLTSLALLPPTIAALALLFVLGLGGAGVTRAHDKAAERRLRIEGEVRFYDIAGQVARERASKAAPPAPGAPLGAARPDRPLKAGVHQLNELHTPTVWTNSSSANGESCLRRRPPPRRPPLPHAFGCRSRDTRYGLPICAGEGLPPRSCGRPRTRRGRGPTPPPAAAAPAARPARRGQGAASAPPRWRRRPPRG